MLELQSDPPPETRGFVMNHSMLRIKDPERSLQFYSEMLGMTLLKRLDFSEMSFSLYFLGYLREPAANVPGDPVERTVYVFKQSGLLELTHNWGTESDPAFAGYHNGNKEPRGFGHVGISVPDVYSACDRLERLGVSFVKKPDEGKMKGIAFITDPDGYWIEILSVYSAARVLNI